MVGCVTLGEATIAPTPPAPVSVAVLSVIAIPSAKWPADARLHLASATIETLA
jgi:hypothetical protein